MRKTILKWGMIGCFGIAAGIGLPDGVFAEMPAGGRSTIGSADGQLAQARNQNNNPFGGLFGGMFGGGNQGTANKNANEAAPAPGGDPIANALKQLDTAKDIEAKALKLEESVGRVIYTVKLYQALNGGIWYRLGLQLNDVYKLNDQAEEGWVKEFIAATQAKRTSGQNALKYVEVNAVDDIVGQNHTIANNNGKIAVLRKSVAAYANAVAGQGTFEKLVANQNVPLDAIMTAYLARIEEITASMDGAALVFGDMSQSYQLAVGDMDKAIQTFDEQSGLVAAEVTKQIAILALEVINITNTIDNAKSNPFQAILVLAQGIQILGDLQKMQETLSNFEQTKNWFDAHSQDILAASRGARAELAASIDTLKMIRPTLTSSWKRQCGAASKAAKSLRQETVAFEKELATVEKRAREKALAVGQSDLGELNALLKKPRRLKSS